MQTCDVVDVGSLKLDSAHCPRRSVRKCEANVRPCKLKCRALLALADFSGGVRVFLSLGLQKKLRMVGDGERRASPYNSFSCAPVNSTFGNLLANSS